MRQEYRRDKAEGSKGTESIYRIRKVARYSGCRNGASNSWAHDFPRVNSKAWIDWRDLLIAVARQGESGWQGGDVIHRHFNRILVT